MNNKTIQNIPMKIYLLGASYIEVNETISKKDFGFKYYLVFSASNFNWSMHY